MDRAVEFSLDRCDSAAATHAPSIAALYIGGTVSSPPPAPLDRRQGASVYAHARFLSRASFEHGMNG